MPLIQILAHRLDVCFGPIQPGPFPAVIDACLQLLGVRDEAFGSPIKQVAVPAGDARVAGGAVFLMYTARIEGLCVPPAEKGERADHGPDRQ